MINLSLTTERNASPRMPLLDLSLLRDTLDGVRHDLERMAGFETAARAVLDALDEIAAAERRRTPLPLSLTEPRFRSSRRAGN